MVVEDTPCSSARVAAGPQGFLLEEAAFLRGSDGLQWQPLPPVWLHSDQQI